MKMSDWRQTLVKFYAFATLVMMPLYYENGYFNTLMAKAHIFWVTAGVVLGMAVLVEAVGFHFGKCRLYSFKEIVSSLNLMDISVGLFGAVAVLSWLFSDYRYEAFTGSEGWHMGAGTIILLVLMYFYVSRNFELDEKIFAFILGAATILFILGMLNGIGVDPLSLHAKLSDDEMYEYIATIGNVNSYAGYLSLIMPVVMGLFIISYSPWQTIWSGIVVVLGFISLFMGNSDGAFLGVGFGLLFLITYSLRRGWKYLRLFTCGIFFGIAAIICKAFEAFWPGEMVSFLGVPKFILDSNIYMPIMAICIILILRYPYCRNKLTKGVCNKLSVVFAVIGIIGVVAVIGYNALIFDGEWGTKRGYIWGFALSVFENGSIREKLIGVGPDCFGIPVMDTFEDFVEEHWGKRVVNAHNEYLQYLVTTGILGVIGYVMMYVSVVREFLKKTFWCEEKGIWLFGVMGYAGQAFVNNPQALNMATLFLFFGIYQSFRYNPGIKDRAKRIVLREIYFAENTEESDER
ncbi:MAG: O-antigen ligase family protein [Eubacterium sp.]|nr:O-antigen ligase family protein [Eubacterium sp.]